MDIDDRGAEAADEARLAEFAERFEAGEIEVDGTAVVRLPKEAFGIHTGLWRLMGDRPAPALYGRAVKEAVAVAYGADGELRGVVLTPAGALVAEDLKELNEQIRVYAAKAWELDAEGVQVTVRLVQGSEGGGTVGRLVRRLSASPGSGRFLPDRRGPALAMRWRSDGAPRPAAERGHARARRGTAARRRSRRLESVRKVVTGVLEGEFEGSVRRSGDASGLPLQLPEEEESVWRLRCSKEFGQHGGCARGRMCD